MDAKPDSGRDDTEVFELRASAMALTFQFVTYAVVTLAVLYLLSLVFPQTVKVEMFLPIVVGSGMGYAGSLIWLSPKQVQITADSLKITRRSGSWRTIPFSQIKRVRTTWSGLELRLSGRVWPQFLAGLHNKDRVAVLIRERLSA